MTNKILHKRSAIPGTSPSTTNLDLGELSINTNDGLVFMKKDSGTEEIVCINKAILTTKGDLYGFSTTASRLPVGVNGQALIVDSGEDLGVKWAEFADGYSYFTVWAEESATISAGSTEYAYGNGDDTPINSGIVIGIDCELFACGGEAEAGTGVNLEVIKNGASIAETGVFNSHTITNVTPVAFLAGDIINFRTKAVTSSGASCRPCAWFRVATIGQKGDQGAPGASGDIVWSGAWIAGTYSINDTVEYNGSSYVCTAATTEQPSLLASDWDLIASKGDIGPSGSTAPYVHLTILTAVNHGGSNGTVAYANWDGSEIHKDSGFTHSTSTNSSRVQVDTAGRYSLYFNIQCIEGGSARTTLMSHYRIDGTTVVIRGRQRNYSRGSGYGDLGVSMTTEVDLTSGQYIEVGTTVDDTDGTYTVNSIPAECELIMRKVA